MSALGYALLLCFFVSCLEFVTAISGPHVCSRSVLKSKIRYTSCGFWGMSRCRRTAYYQSTENYCCEGWKADANGFCELPICRIPCQNGGTCIAPDKCQCPSSYDDGMYCTNSTNHG
ncbi:epidermal growth factor-like protein 8 [Mya arenaria]|uniref:epidermal growth factor-like protein 8 n=1 Tax=Mya arenaria TaxID=6604 RepID=UPI0022E7F031|nr:epidermal growth factor-like protein 8 [Mya arenaria]